MLAPDPRKLIVDQFRESLHGVGALDDIPDLLLSEACQEAIEAFKFQTMFRARSKITRITAFKFLDTPRFRMAWTTHNAPHGQAPRFRDPVELPAWRVKVAYQYVGDWFLVLDFFKAIGVNTEGGSPEMHSVLFWADDFAKLAVMETLRGNIRFPNRG